LQSNYKNYIMEDQNLTPEKSFELINQVINASKNKDLKKTDSFMPFGVCLVRLPHWVSLFYSKTDITVSITTLIL